MVFAPDPMLQCSGLGPQADDRFARSILQTLDFAISEVFGPRHARFHLLCAGVCAPTLDPRHLAVVPVLRRYSDSGLML